MKLLIDIQSMQTESRYRGIGKYSFNLVKGILRNAPQFEISLLLNSAISVGIDEIFCQFEGVISRENILVFDSVSTIKRSSWVARANELSREVFIDKFQPDVLLVTSLFETEWAGAVSSIGSFKSNFKTAVIFYDLIPLKFKNEYLCDKTISSYYFRKLKQLKKADLLLSISYGTTQDGLRLLNQDNIRTISCGIDEEFKNNSFNQKNDLEALIKLDIKKPFILYVPGGGDFRKNFLRLLNAYSQLPIRLLREYQLVIAGKLNSAELILAGESFGLKKSDVIYTGFVSNYDLSVLYSNTHLFIHPSLAEGFGLPLVEAMVSGAVVIASNIDSFREVLIDDALFDPYSVSSIAKKIEYALTNLEFREIMLDFNKSASEKFNWNKVSLSAIGFLEQLSLSSKGNVHSRSADDYIDFFKCLDIDGKEPSDIEFIPVAKSLAFNIGRSKPHLLLDISTLVKQDAKTGIQRVVRSLLKALVSADIQSYETYAIYFDDKERFYKYAKTFCFENLNLVSDLYDSAVDFVQGDKYFSLDLNAHLSTEIHNLQLHLRSKGVYICHLVYDILPLRHPEWWPMQIVYSFTTWFKNVSIASNELICISESVAKDVHYWLTENSPQLISGLKISSFHLGADIQNSLPTLGIPHSANFLFEKINQEVSFLVVCTIEPRKGVGQLLSAFEIMWQEGCKFNLVIVGSKGWLVDDLIMKIENHEMLNTSLFWLSGISDEYLTTLYKSCDCLILASEGEGFGLPIIEGAINNIPIIARDLEVFREIANHHAYYFKGKNAEDLYLAILDWINLFNSNKHPKIFGLVFLTWAQSATQLIELLKLSESRDA
jgi:glycosyltransferase involved in cell wall biosynthesis